MITIDYEYFVSLEVAELLKEAGFDWRCKYSYITTPEGEMPTGEEGILIEYAENINWLVSAPTLDVSHRWLRVVKGIHLYVRPILDEHKYVVTVVVDDLTWGQVNDNNGTWKRFNTYEEAQEAGIKKALEMILKWKNQIFKK